MKQIVRGYARDRAGVVCADLTARARRSLGGSAACRRKIRIIKRLDPALHVTVRKIEFRRERAWADVSGFLGGRNKHRLAVAFKWDDGSYRLDHALTKWRGLFG